MIFIGIDPGKHGGIAVLNDKREIQDLQVLQDALWFSKFMKGFIGIKEPLMVFMEKVQVMGPASGGLVSMLNYGYGAGQLDGILFASEIPFELVAPISWTKVMHAGIAAADRPKVRSLMAVQRLFPSEDFRNPDAPKSKKAHDGIIDALLIAEYGRRKWIFNHV